MDFSTKTGVQTDWTVITSKLAGQVVTMFLRTSSPCAECTTTWLALTRSSQKNYFQY